MPDSVITGNIGVSPIAATAMTGFSLTADVSNSFWTSAQVDGKAFAADDRGHAPDYASTTPAMLTTTVLDMEAAYTDASQRAFTGAGNLNIHAGLISGTTFTEGVYQWGSDVTFTSDIYIKGNKYSKYIFQSTGNVIAGSGAKVLLQEDDTGNGMPHPANIVWVMAGYLDAGTTSHLEGIMLVKTKAVFKTHSSLNGRILAQTVNPEPLTLNPGGQDLYPSDHHCSCPEAPLSPPLYPVTPLPTTTPVTPLFTTIPMQRYTLNPKPPPSTLDREEINPKPSTLNPTP